MLTFLLHDFTQGTENCIIMILSCQNISKAFLDTNILNNISFQINERDRLAIVGINGAGKSTLLKIIAGQLSADSGQVIIPNDVTVGYLAQHQSHDCDETIYDEIMSCFSEIMKLEEDIRLTELKMKNASDSELDELYKTYARLTHEFEVANGYSCKSEAVGVLKGLGFSEDDFDRPVNSLSGGQKMRVALAKLLLTKPSLMMLDEPVNHLDMQSVAWLESYIASYPGTVIIVAHDRYFLDKVATKVLGIENGNGYLYTGTYTDFAKKRASVRENELKAYLNQQREIKHQEEVIEKLRSFNREKSIKRAESREKLLGKMDVIDKPVEFDASMKIRLTPSCVSGNDVLSVKNLSKSFDTNNLFNDISFEIKRGEKVAIIGNNGTGKTTILKMINELISPDSGTITLGANVSIGYYDQEHQVLNDDNTLFEEISDERPDMNNTSIRNVLASFLFTGDDVFKKVSALSGGEKGRLSLAKLMLSTSNLLILDEPTNHLDITSKEILEDAINNYEGTVLYVSHDRYFINKTATRILDLTGKTIIEYIGNYDYYVENREHLEAIYLSGNESTAASPADTGSSSNITDSKKDWKAGKEEQARLRKLANEIKKTEEEIEKLETRNCQIDELLALEEYYSNPEKLVPLSTERSDNEKRIEELYEQWEELSSQQ